LATPRIAIRIEVRSSSVPNAAAVEALSADRARSLPDGMRGMRTLVVVMRCSTHT
jgi:hypothetical protein